jgi:hypothetical protein
MRLLDLRQMLARFHRPRDSPNRTQLTRPHVGQTPACVVALSKLRVGEAENGYCGDNGNCGCMRGVFRPRRPAALSR